MGFTLFQMMCLDDWGDVAREVSAIYSYAGLLFIVFLLFTTFCMLNMFVAVFCFAVHELEEIRLAAKKAKRGSDEDDDDDSIEMDSCAIHSFLDQEQELAAKMKLLAKAQEKTIKKMCNISKQLLHSKTENKSNKICNQ